MIKNFIPFKHDVSAFENELKNLASNSYKSALILSAVGTNFDPAEYNPILRKSPLKIIGGIFPEILFEGKRYSEGSIIVGFEEEIQVEIVRSFTENEMSSLVTESLDSVDPENKTVFIFIDAFVENKTLLTDALYNSFGTIANYVGAGAGSLDFKSFHCLFSNEGLIKGGGIIGILDMESSLGVAHGWEAISEPLKVTEAEKNRTITLEWEVASQKYKKFVSAHMKENIDNKDFFSLTKNYPLGISKFGAEMVVRDAFKEEDGAILTLDEIEQGSHVHILYGNLDALLMGAKKARSLAKIGDSPSSHEVLIIDCISRVLFMDADFALEIKELDPDGISFGALSLGEIANNGDAYLEIFNKTAVVCNLNG